MKVLKVTSQNQISFYEENIPQIGSRDVLTKVKYCGVCGTDVSIFSGESSLVKNGSIKYPVRIGHEWSGIVEAVGSEVKEFKVGDRVVGDTAVACGECKACLGGKYMLCPDLRCVGTVNAWDGGLAEYTIFPARHLYKIPDSVSLDEAALIEPAAISMFAIHNSKLIPGQTVLVIGTGAIGIIAAAIASVSGASKVILSGRNDFKLEIGKKMGADVTVNIRKEALKDVIMRETGGKGVDVIIEASGSIPALTEAFELVKIGGTVALLAFYEKEIEKLNIDKIVFNCIKIIGVAGSPNMYLPVIDLLEAGRISFKTLITHRFPFDRAIDAINAVKDQNDTRIKILVEF